jgi:hypothetical protein
MKMNRQRIWRLTVASIGLLVVMLCSPVLWADLPAQEVLLEYDSTPDFVTGEWTGPAIIWIDGVRYEGTVIAICVGSSNANGWHGRETLVFDFPDLGELVFSGVAQTTFAYVTPEHRWHSYASHTRITDGTGVFADAHGVFQFVGYTDWLLPPYYVPPQALAFGGGEGMVIGIQMD